MAIYDYSCFNPTANYVDETPRDLLKPVLFSGSVIVALEHGGLFGDTKFLKNCTLVS